MRRTLLIGRNDLAASWLGLAGPSTTTCMPMRIAFADTRPKAGHDS
jgi:hypothetical protein